MKELFFSNKKSLLLKYSLMICLLFFTFLESFAQSQSIKGTVTDKQNEPLIGVTIQIKGTKLGTITDFDGNYSLAAKAGDVLEFSSIGMVTQSKTVTPATTVIDIVMSDDNQLLDEVVVIGYGSAKKADLTGSISSVSAKEILKQPAMNAMQSAQGKLAGVNIVTDGNPGSNPVITIRGTGTALGGREPLYIVDGFPTDNISTISPSDIVSMNVLKDASSASIYGLRAANGVVMITTRRGESGTPRISVDIYAGIKSTMNKVKMANGSQFITYFNEDMSMQKEYGSDKAFLLSDQQPFNTDWYKELLHTGFSNNNSVSVSGGSKAVDYFLSYNFFDEKGVLSGQTYQRSTIRNNNVYKFYDDRFKITQTLNISFSQGSPKPLNAFNSAYRQAPIVPVQYSNGRYGGSRVNTGTGLMWAQEGDVKDGQLNSIGNPIFEVDRYNERQKAFTLQAGVEAEFKITDYLKANTRFGSTKYDYKSRVFTNVKDNWLYGQGPTSTDADFEAERAKGENAKSPSFADNSLALDNSNTLRWTWEGFVTFNKSFDGHNVEAVVGTSREKSNIGDMTKMTGYNVPEKSQYWSMDFASRVIEKKLEQHQYTRLALASYFGRMQYNYKSKYYLAATVRRDGSSVFKQGEKYWGTFPSFGVGWTITEEDFMQDVSFLNYFKLRGNWGKLGNQNIPFNQSTFDTNVSSGKNNYVFGNLYTAGATIGTPAKDLSWEVTRETGIGFDYTVLNNRLSGTFDYYDKMNTNAILDVSPIYTSEYENNYYDHVGKISNRGIELGLNWRDQLPSGFSYSVGVNYSHNTNKVKELKAMYEGATGGSLSDGQITKRLTNNTSLYSWWMFEADGVWQSKEEIAEAKANGEAIWGTPHPGYLKYKDVNGDGVINDNDKVNAGSYMPKYTYGINISMEYKNFDLSIDGYGVGGNKIYNYLKYARISSGENISRDVFKNRWTGAGSTNTHPGANREAVASTYYLESGRYFRINNITLGYTFNDLIFKGSRLRTYVTAQNPFLFTPYKGFTPEMVGGDGGAPSKTAGIEMSAYPLNRNFLVGFNLQF